MKYCSKCGNQPVDEAVVCPKCGCAVEGAKINNNPNLSTDLKNFASTSGEDCSPKSRLVASLLAFFLGCFGVHNFYLGKTGQGVAQLILSITGIGLIVTGIWVLVDFIVLLCGNAKDANGKSVRKW